MPALLIPAWPNLWGKRCLLSVRFILKAYILFSACPQSFSRELEELTQRLAQMR